MNSELIATAIRLSAGANQQPSLTAGDQVIVFGHLFKFLRTTADSNNQYSIYEDNVPPAGGPPPHTHPDEELFYVLEGEFEFLLHDLSKPIKASAGAFICIPSMAVHTFKNVGSTTGRMITMLLPGNLEHYFNEIGSRVTSPSQAPDLSVPPDFANMDLSKAFQLAGQHQVSFLLPGQ
jgi:quercetin dioxygenase-like cupin family protein